jgi:hypothetical protein
VSDSSRFHFVSVQRNAEKKTSCLLYRFVHEDADARRPWRVSDAP